MNYLLSKFHITGTTRTFLTDFDRHNLSTTKVANYKCNAANELEFPNLPHNRPSRRFLIIHETVVHDCCYSLIEHSGKVESNPLAGCC